MSMTELSPRTLAFGLSISFMARFKFQLTYNYLLYKSLQWVNLFSIRSEIFYYQHIMESFNSGIYLPYFPIIFVCKLTIFLPKTGLAFWLLDDMNIFWKTISIGTVLGFMIIVILLSTGMKLLVLYWIFTNVG